MIIPGGTCKIEETKCLLDEITKDNMPHSIEYDPLGIISIKVQGTLTMTVVRNFAMDAVHLAKEKDCFRVLTDLQEAKLRLSMLELYNLPKVLSEIAATTGLQVYQFKRVVITRDDDEELLPFYENVARNRIQNLRLFHDVESAQQWLLEA